MTDSEMRAIVQASFMVLQKLIVEVAATVLLGSTPSMMTSPQK
ncbi:hypothetical protein [Sinorhizobium meliloti]|nr:hypothetical protein [Sinorhizobium meliloti]